MHVGGQRPKIICLISLATIFCNVCVRVGMLARAMDALKSSQDSPPYKSNLFSIFGSTKVVSGSQQVPPNIVSAKDGIARFSEKEYPKLQASLL